MRYATVCRGSSEKLGYRSAGFMFLFIIQESITAKACYSSDKVHENIRVTPRMGAGTGAAPGQAPPDLPSLLLDGRICYIGMPVSLCFCMLQQLCFLVCWRVYDSVVSSHAIVLHAMLLPASKTAQWRTSAATFGASDVGVTNYYRCRLVRHSCCRCYACVEHRC